MKFYRYRDILTTSGVQILLEEFVLVKETPKEYWIKPNWPDWIEIYKKWISKSSTKRFACPSKEEALNSYIARKKRQIIILQHKLKRAEIALRKTEWEKELEEI